jgi:glycosyltransferase involved in cell wall biosynthesis
VSRSAARFEAFDGRPLVDLPAFRLEDRATETIVEGEAETWVIVPALDEATGILATLQAIDAQTLRPLVLCVVDNGSSDATPDLVRAFRPRPGLGVCLVAEPERGTGAAADTGMRLAIAAGARYLLRTDADSLPRPQWAARLRDELARGAELVAGRIIPRDDERFRPGERAFLQLVMTVSAALAVPRNARRGRRTRFRLLAGNNMGIRAGMYERSGGFPRSRIDEVHEDRALMNRVRFLTERIVSARGAIVATSARRYRAYGLVGVLRWYTTHGTSGLPVDVR